MKLLIRIFNISVCLILLTLILVSQIQKDTIQSELRHQVSEALLQATRPLIDKRYDLEINEFYIAEFEQHLLTHLHYYKGMQLDLYYFGVDVNEGILSIIVDLKVPFLFFEQRMIHVNTKQTILLEEDTKKWQWYDIRYHGVELHELAPTSPIVHVYGKETLLVEPKREGYRFKEFQDSLGNPITKIDATIHQAMDVYAIWE